MSERDPEEIFMDRASAAIPGVEGYRQPSSRGDTDVRVREHLASGLEALAGRFGEIREAADVEGDLDMVDDLERIRERIERTTESLRGADYRACRFFLEAEVSEERLGRIYAYDAAMLGDLELLTKDVQGLKYDSIGTLTLREVEGTLASIELRIANRGDLFDMPSS